MKTAALAAVVALIGAAGSCGAPVPVAPGPQNLVVYAGFEVSNGQGEPIGAVVNVTLSAKSGDAVAMGPVDINETINTNRHTVSIGKFTDEGGWEYPIGIGAGAGAVTISLTVHFVADPREIVSCYLSNTSGGHGVFYDEDIKQAGSTASLLTATCFAVVTN